MHSGGVRTRKGREKQVSLHVLVRVSGTSGKCGECNTGHNRTEKRLMSEQPTAPGVVDTHARGFSFSRLRLGTSDEGPI
jgi:hypothetical protein